MWALSASCTEWQKKGKILFHPCSLTSSTLLSLESSQAAHRTLIYVHPWYLWWLFLDLLSQRFQKWDFVCALVVRFFTNNLCRVFWGMWGVCISSVLQEVTNSTVCPCWEQYLNHCRTLIQFPASTLDGLPLVSPVLGGSQILFWLPRHPHTWDTFTQIHIHK